MGKVGSSVDSSTGGKVVGTSSGNGGLVGGDDRSVRVGDQVGVQQSSLKLQASLPGFKFSF